MISVESVGSVESVFADSACVSVPFTDPCLNHHCKKGKVCEVDESNTPMCVCQDPSTCPAAEGEFEHVSFLNSYFSCDCELITHWSHSSELMFGENLGLGPQTI